GRVIKAPVIEAVKGGLVVDVGIRAFMPASHVERGYVSDLNAYVGKNVRARVIELDRSKNRVILSQKVVLEEEYQRQREQTWASLEEGQIRRGIVKGITDFGAFIDLGGVDGLLHVSEMAWNRVDHPSDVVQEGQEVQVKVLKVDRERERISLSLKQTLPDPWQGLEQRYPPGAIVEGQVVRLAPFGAFVRLEPGVEGLVHISQLADYHVKTPSEVVREGDTVRVKVLKVQPEDRRVSLSIKEAQRPAGEPREADDRSKAPAPNRNRQAKAERERPRGYDRDGAQPEPAREGVTLGDMFGDLFQETRERLAQQQRERDVADDDASDGGRDESEAR
ncbi:MAG TPA: 30S ribosomal protein S1, partial [Bacillota bacterium]